MPIRQRYVSQATIAADGTASIEFTMRADFWLMQTSWTVVAADGTNPADQSTATNTINGEDFEGTYSGNKDSSGTVHLLVASDVLRCQWTGATPGCRATLTLRGIEYPAGKGMDALAGGGAGGPPLAGPGPSNPILGGTVLIRDAIQSRNYDPGVAGWAIMANGTAEFSDATLRGSLSADNGNVLVNDNGVTVTGSQQIVTIVDTGLFVRENPDSGGYVQLAAAANFGGLTFYKPTNSSVAGVAFTSGNVFADSVETVTDSRPYLNLSSPNINGAPDLGHSRVILRGQALSSAVDDSYVEIVGTLAARQLFDQLTADAAPINSTTLVTVLSVDLPIAGTYTFDALFDLTNSGAAGRPAFALGGTSTPSAWRWVSGAVHYNTEIGSQGFNASGAAYPGATAGSNLVNSDWTTTGGFSTAHIKGTVTITDPGTLNFRFATSGAVGQNINVKAGSMVTVDLRDF